MEEENQEIFTESHAKSILSTMNTLRKDGTLCDVTLRVQGQSFMAHRIVLAACSDYFCAMFTNEVRINPLVLNLIYLSNSSLATSLEISCFECIINKVILKRNMNKNQILPLFCTVNILLLIIQYLDLCFTNMLSCERMFK